MAHTQRTDLNDTQQSGVPHRNFYFPSLTVNLSISVFLLLDVALADRHLSSGYHES